MVMKERWESRPLKYLVCWFIFNVDGILSLLCSPRSQNRVTRRVEVLNHGYSTGLTRSRWSW